MSAPRDVRRLAPVLAALLAVAACSRAKPETHITVAAEDGRLVPLDSVTTSFTVNGVQVIHRPNAATDVVAVRLYLLGGTRQLMPATQGIEPLILQAADFGTTRYPGPASRAAWGRTGSDISIVADADWTMYGFEGVRQEFDSSFAVFADRVMSPTLAARHVKLVGARMIAGLRQRRAHPDGFVTLLADSIAFATHPYGLNPDGTEASLAALDSATLARYVAGQMVQSRLLLVVVGNVKREEVERVVSRSLATLPRGAYSWSLPEPMPRPKSSVTFVRGGVTTNYVLGVFQGPRASDHDFSAFRIATALLGSRISTMVRQERGLSYAAYAPFTERGVAAGGLYVSTTAPAEVLPLMKRAIEEMKDFPAGAVNMRYIADQWILDYLAENSTSAAQADFLARAQLYFGDYRKAPEAMESLRKVTGGSVRSASVRYFRNIQFVYLGDSTKVQRRAFGSF